MSDRLWPDPAAGVFETLLIVDGSPIELAAHLQRLRTSVHELFAAELPAGTRDLALDAASPLPLGRMRVTVSPAAARALGADAVATAVDPEDVFPAWERAIALRPLVIDGGLGAHKWVDRGRLAHAESDECSGQLPLLLDRSGEVLEASRANVFAVEGELLVTPAADGRILAGVTRARAIESARSLGLELREQALTVDRLMRAGQAFLTGSVRGLEPVRSVGDAELEPPGEVARELAAALKRHWIGDGAGLRAPRAV